MTSGSGLTNLSARIFSASFGFYSLEEPSEVIVAPKKSDLSFSWSVDYFWIVVSSTSLAAACSLSEGKADSSSCGSYFYTTILR